MKEVILKNNLYRVIREEKTYHNNDGSSVTFYRHKLQKKSFIFWRTIVTHPYLEKGDCDGKAYNVYHNLFVVIKSATVIS